MDETTVKKACENCLYFIQHYIKSNTRFCKTCAGHCVNDKTSRKTKNKTRTNFVCEFWEMTENQVEKRKTSVSEALLKIAEQVDEIYVFIKDYFDTL